MKKIYTLIVAAAFSFNNHAQVVNFDAHLSTAETYDNGSGGGGDFIFSQAVFNNVYDTTWGSWYGFAISNVTDNTTPGWGNQYSAYPGSGANSSSGYAIAYSSPEISGVSPYEIFSSFRITNATYTAISMRDGDAFSKKFGSPNDASGAPDGTNGEDYYRVWIICEDASGANKDSIEYYLADYRFVDSTQDYIVDYWDSIDVSTTTMGFAVNKISFRFESSDVGAWGINTPVYFAIDDVEYHYPIGLEELSLESVVAYPNPVNNRLTVEGGTGNIALMDMNGKVMLQGQHDGVSQLDCSSLPSGVYMLVVSNDTATITRRIVK